MSIYKLCHIFTTLSFVALTFAAEEDDEPQKVLIESNESWQNGVVLIYSTIILIGLRLSAAIRHSPLSPLRPTILRMHLYAIAMFLIGSVSSLTLLLLSIFSETRDIARDLMPCASPLLAVGAILALYPQTRPPQWDSQQLTALVGVPTWLAFVAAFIFNGMTVAASVLNGAWAATSISVATTLVAIFGPRTPVVQNALANGIVEPGGPLIFKVRQFREHAIIALTFWKHGSVTRELVGPSWTKLQSINEFGQDRQLRIGAYPAVSKVIVSDNMCSHLALLSDREARRDSYVELISGETSDSLGYLRLEDWLREPVGEDVIAVQIYMNDFTMQMLGAKIWSACSKEAESDFPGAFETYWTILRRILEPMPRPDYESLRLTPGSIDLAAEMSVRLDEYAGSIMKVETLTEDLPQPHRNIMRVVLTAKLSKHYEVHVGEIIHLILDAAAGVISGDCTEDGKMASDISELCVVFDDIDDGLVDGLVDYDEIYAILTDKNTRTVHWITKSDKGGLQAYLDKAAHAVILSDTDQDMDLSVHVEAMRLSKKSNGKLQLSKTAIPVQACSEIRSRSVQELDEGQWNESRLKHPQRVWPSNWERGEPTSAIAVVKGMAEIASLQAITSGIAAGSVLVGSLFGT